MGKWLVFIIGLALIGPEAFAQLSRASGVKENRAFIYHGKLVRPDGSTPTGSAAVTVKITSPDPSMCVLWAESQTVKLDNGSFAMELGHTVNRVSGASGGAASSFKQVFVNNAGLTHSSATCASGNSYTPTSADDRLLFATFNDGGALVEIAGLPIKSVPFALQAEEIGGYGLSNLVKISGAGSSVVFTPNEVQSLSDMLGGDIEWNMKNRRVTGVAAPTAATDAVNKGHLDAALAAISLSSPAITTALGYTPLNKSGDSMTGVLGLLSVASTPSGLGASDAGKMWFDSNTGEIKFWNGTSAVAVGISGGGLTSIGLSAPSIFSVTGSPLTANGTITLSLASQSANRVFASPDGSAGAPTFRALLPSDIPALDAAKITTGTFTASQIPSLDTGKVTTGVLGVARGGTGLAPIAGDANKVYGVNSAGTGSEFKNITGAGTVSVSHSAGGITITGAGDGAGTVTSVGVGGLPLSVTNATSTPTLSIAQANTTTAGYLSSTDWNTFNNKQGAALAQDNVWVGNGSNVATAKLLRISDIKANTTGNPSFLNASGACTSGQALGYNSVTDRLECAAYALTSSQVTTALGFTPADSANAVLKGGNAGAFSIGTTNSNPLSIIANGATAMTVLANGNVGIGTTSPSNLISGVKTSGTQLQFGIAPGSGGFLTSMSSSQAVLSGGMEWNGSAWVARSTSAGNIGVTSGKINFTTDSGLTDGNTFVPSARMTIDSNGNVGVGTTSPSAYIDISPPTSAAAAPILQAFSPAHIDFAAQDVAVIQGGPASSYTGTLLKVQTRQAAGSGFALMDLRTDANTTPVSKFYVRGDGYVGVGTISPTAKMTVSANTVNLPGIGTLGATVLHVAGADAANTASIIDAYGASNYPVMALRKARGTAAAPTAVQSGDYLGTMVGVGYDGSNYRSKVSINFLATENWTTAANGNAIAFQTSTNGVSNATERVRIDHNGYVGIGTTTPGQKLTVAGMIESTSGGLKFPDGTTQTTAATGESIVRGYVNGTTGACTGCVGATTSRSAAGTYTVTFTAAMANTTYIFIGTANPATNAPRTLTTSGRATGSTSVYINNSGGTLIDADWNFVIYP